MEKNMTMRHHNNIHKKNKRSRKQKGGVSWYNPKTGKWEEGPDVSKSIGLKPAVQSVIDRTGKALGVSDLGLNSGTNTIVNTLKDNVLTKGISALTVGTASVVGRGAYEFSKGSYNLKGIPGYLKKSFLVDQYHHIKEEYNTTWGKESYNEYIKLKNFINSIMFSNRKVKLINDDMIKKYTSILNTFGKLGDASKSKQLQDKINTFKEQIHAYEDDNTQLKKINDSLSALKEENKFFSKEKIDEIKTQITKIILKQIKYRQTHQHGGRSGETTPMDQSVETYPSQQLQMIKPEEQFIQGKPLLLPPMLPPMPPPMPPLVKQRMQMQEQSQLTQQPQQLFQGKPLLQPPMPPMPPMPPTLKANMEAQAESSEEAPTVQENEIVRELTDLRNSYSTYINNYNQLIGEAEQSSVPQEKKVGNDISKINNRFKAELEKLDTLLNNNSTLEETTTVLGILYCSLLYFKIASKVFILVEGSTLIFVPVAGMTLSITGIQELDLVGV